MTKTILVLLACCIALYAQTPKKNVSKYEVREGKRVYFPIKTTPASNIIQSQIVKPNVRMPVVKGVFVNYNK